ncbi:hypothetical protein [Yeosuana marina]|uniref:hypothetical protein n=1 Tax=Yeosuana marina TaxID=1565536 RepID=UPI0030EDA315|tara:strand:+ start:2685 stop:3323 length:639 start_codon:yes stop_codon:yes gene_type:complete
MKSILLIFVIFLIVFSCKNREGKKNSDKNIFYYPNKKAFKDSTHLSNIYLDSFKNFNQLVDRIHKTLCEDSIPVINIETPTEKFRLIQINGCPNINTSICEKTRNVITITSDSIYVYVNDGIGIDNLEETIKNHIINPKKEFKYSSPPEKAIIQIHVDKKFGIIKTKKLLLKTFNAFNKINESQSDSLSLKIRFTKFLFKEIPPPPPPEDYK